MPVVYEIHQRTGVAVLTLSGDVQPDEVKLAVEELRKDPGLQPSFNLLVDARPMLANDFTGSGIRSLALGPALVASSSKRAVLVETDYGFGMSRMFNLNLGEEELQFAIFRDEDEARRHVGLLTGPAQGKNDAD